MEKVYESEGCIVFDDVLPPDQLEAIFESFRTTDFRIVHETQTYLPKHLQHGYKRAWRIDEGHALFSKSTVCMGLPETDIPQELLALAKDWSEKQEMPFYPTDTPSDYFIETLKHLATTQLQSWIGQVGQEWLAFVATPYIHPPGVGMSWHQDNHLYTGAFSFFVHPEWDAEFGGEFLICDDTIQSSKVSTWNNRKYDPLSVEVSDDLHSLPTGGRFIQPAPNRLIVIKRGVMHKVNRVNPIAGSHMRTSITGFFLDTEIAQQMLTVEE